MTARNPTVCGKPATHRICGCYSSTPCCDECAARFRESGAATTDAVYPLAPEEAGRGLACGCYVEGVAP